MKKTIGIFLILVGLALGAYGLTVQKDKNTLVEIGDISVTDDLEVSDNNPGMWNFATIGGGILLIGGILTLVVKGK